MDNYLRQLLTLINSNPAPGHEQPPGAPSPMGPPSPYENFTASNTTVPIHNLGKVGGVETGVANRLPIMAPNGRGSYEPAPPEQQQPGLDPNDIQVERGGLSPQEGMPMDDMAVTHAEPTRGPRRLEFSDKTTPMQPQAPVHLHLDEKVLQALIKHKSKPIAEGE